MNKEYVYVDGKAVVEDTNGEKRLVQYQDNLDELLIQENLIEKMENDIVSLEEEYNKGYSKSIPIFSLSFILLIFFGIKPIMEYFFEYEVLNSVVDITFFGKTFNLLGFIKCILSIVFIPFGIVSDIMILVNNKKNKQIENGLKNIISFLKQQLEYEKNKLIRLKNDKKFERLENVFKVVKIKDKEVIKNLDSYSDLYFDLGYYEKYFYKMYKKGKLEDTLKKYYSLEKIEAAERYFDRKGPVLERKRKNN